MVIKQLLQHSRSQKHDTGINDAQDIDLKNISAYNEAFSFKQRKFAASRGKSLQIQKLVQGQKSSSKQFDNE